MSQNQTEGRVRRHDGRIYVTLAGVEHGMSDCAALALAVALAYAAPPQCPLRTAACSRYEVVTEPADPLIWSCIQAACPLSVSPNHGDDA